MDKFRKTAPLNITFSDAEQPTAQKLTAVAVQSRNALALLESAIGDPWSQSGDATLTDDYLQIPNLARMLGQNKYLNPALYPGTQTFKYTEGLGSKFENLSVGRFLFAPTNGTVRLGGLPGGYVIDVDTNNNFVTPVTNEYDVDAAGKYWVDVNTGRFRIYDVLDILDKISYEVNPEASDGWAVSDDTLPGVIPDPRQTKFLGIRVSTSASKYFIHLPPRRPLTLTDRETPSRYPPAGDISDNEATATGTPYRYWQYATAALTGVGSDHYRYQLPLDILNTIASLTPGTELPAGFLFLWDNVNKTIIEDIVFKKPSTGGFLDYVIEVESSSYNFSSKVTASELEADYNTDLVLITCGSPLARSIHTIANAFWKHGHRNDGSFEDTVSHGDLTDLDPPINDAAVHLDRYPTYLPSWHPSRWDSDHHTSLLSRVGSQSSGVRQRDIYNNAMLGDLLIANADTSGVDNYLDLDNPDNSFEIRFGDLTGPGIYGVDADTIRIDDRMIMGTDTVSGLWHVELHGVEAAAGGVGGAYMKGGDVSVDSSITAGVGLQVQGGDASSTVNDFGAVSLIVKPGGTDGSGVGSAIQNALKVEGTSLFQDEAQIVRTSGRCLYVTSEVANVGCGVLEVLAITSAGSGIITKGFGTGNGIRASGGDSNGTAIVGIGGGTNGDGISGQGLGTGSGIKGTGLNGYGVVAESDTTTPVKSAFRIVPQDTDPGTTPTKGDIYINDDDGLMRTHNGDKWAHVVGKLYSSVNTSDDITTVAATPVLFAESYTVPASSYTPGAVFRISVLVDVLTIPSAGSFNIDIKFGGTYVGRCGSSPGIIDFYKMDCIVVLKNVDATNFSITGASSSLEGVGAGTTSHLFGGTVTNKLKASSHDITVEVVGSANNDTARMTQFVVERM